MLRTKSGLPKHCSWNTDQHGKRRVRFRKAGFTIYLTGIPWSEDFMRQYAAAVEGVKAQASNVGIERTKPGSFNALCVSYYRSPEFHGLKASTQALRRNIIERWSEAEAARFEAVYPIGTKERLALALLLYTGQRVSDVARMGWQHVKGKWIAVRQEKTDTPLMLKMHPELVRILAAVSRSNLTFLVTDRGAAFSAAGLSNWFGKRCRAAGLSHCTAHGLRKLALTRRANAGASTEMLKAFGGHKTSKNIEPYTRSVNQARLDEQGLELQLRAEREQDLSNLETRLDKNG
jgi:integrase